jgi:hypothetical protein
MRCICINSAGLEAEQGHKVKPKVLTPLKFLTSPSFSVTLPSCDPAKRGVEDGRAPGCMGRRLIDYVIKYLITDLN